MNRRGFLQYLALAPLLLPMVDIADIHVGFTIEAVAEGQRLYADLTPGGEWSLIPHKEGDWGREPNGIALEAGASHTWVRFQLLNN